MKSILLKTAALALFAAVVGGIVLLHLENGRLQRRIEELRGRAKQVASLRERNQHLRELVSRTEAGASDAAEVVRTEVARAKAEVAVLEARAREARERHLAQTAATADALATNRDPAKGLTRLERFANVGQGTPSAALQTLVWAALKGDADTINRSFTLSDAARAKAEALIAALPEDGRAQWTPEKLGAMFFTGFFTEVTAAEVTAETLDAPQRATLKLRVSNGTRENTIPLAMELGANGWQAVVSDRHIDAIRKKMAPPEAKK
jgi:hypothetical protein